MPASQEPQHLGKNDWYYEYPTYLLLVHEVKYLDGKHFRTDQIKIPWRMIKRSMTRAYKPAKRARRR